MRMIVSRIQTKNPNVREKKSEGMVKEMRTEIPVPRTKDSRNVDGESNNRYMYNVHYVGL